MPGNARTPAANVESVDTWAVTLTPAGLDESWARVHRIASLVVASPAPTARKETAATAVPGRDAASNSEVTNSAEYFWIALIQFLLGRTFGIAWPQIDPPIGRDPQPGGR